MPRPSPYVGWRRWASQAVMWAILAGTVGLAALVDRRVDASKRVSLAPPREWGDVTVRMPRGWVPAEASRPPGVVAAVREPLPEGAGREIAVYRERVPTLLSPLEYLTTSRVVDADVGSTEAGGGGDQGREQAMAPMRLAGTNGVLVTVTVVDPADGEPHKTLTACAILPSREAVSVKLQGPGTIDQSDLRLIEQVAASVAVRGGARLLGDGGEVTFDDGTTLRAPAGMRPVADRDELVTTRYVVDDRAPMAWAAAEVTPCVFARGDGVGGARWLFVARDLRWFGARVEELGPGRYKLSPQEGAQGPLPMTGYLIADEAGHALLAVFHGMPRRTGEFDAMWAGVEKTVRFPSGGNYDAMGRAGAAAADRLRRTGLTRLLGNDRADLWWRWTDPQAGQDVGWTRFYFVEPTGLAAARETRWRVEPGGVMYVTHKWLANDDMTEDRSRVTQRLAGADPRKPPTAVLQQDVWAHNGRISVNQEVRGQALPTMEFVQAPNFVPGGWLPRLAGRLAGDKPLLLRSDAVWGPPASGAIAEGDLGTACQLVMVTPVNAGPAATTTAAATGVTTAPADATGAGRTFLVEVNGSGKRSRWTIGADGTVDRVEFAGGLRAERTDVAVLRMTFDQDHRLTP